MIKLKTAEEIERLRKAGNVLATILDVLESMVAPGITTEDLDDRAMELIEEYGAEPALLGYHPRFAPRPYPAAICTSVNDVVVHGIPNENAITLKEGDTVGIDVTIGVDGMLVDSARTVPVGKVAPEVQKLLDVTKEARAVGIKAARVGGHIGDIGAAIEEFVKPYGYGVVRELCGHGVGYAVHEEPNVPNYGTQDTGPEIEEGLVLAIEPMLTLGSGEVIFDEVDGYTVRTKGGEQSAHFEHTVVITKDGPEILTQK